jgi:sugar phosphate permease
MESAGTILAGSGESERAERSRWSYWRFRIFLAAWVLYAAYYFCRKNFSVVMPMMARTSHYNNFDLAHAVFVFSLAYAAGQFLAGTLGDRFGGRLVGSAGGFLSAACTAAMAMTSSYQALLLLQIGNGLGQGCGWSSCLKVLGTWFARKERGTVMAWWAPAMYSADSSPPCLRRLRQLRFSFCPRWGGGGASCSQLSCSAAPPFGLRYGRVMRRAKRLCLPLMEVSRAT